MQTRTSTSVHRRRLTDLESKFISCGLDSLTDLEVIQLLFRLTSPHEPYKKQARQCVKEFGGLRGLTETCPNELLERGVTHEVILLAKLLSDIPARILKERAAVKPIYQSSQAVVNYLHYSMRGLKNEIFKVIHLDGRNRIIDTADLFKGTVDNIPVIPRQILEAAIKCRSVAVIYAHNHPSGDPTPSSSDRRLTRDLVFVGSAVQIRVLDHIIVGDGNYFSFADEGLIQKYEDTFLTLRMKTPV